MSKQDDYVFVETGLAMTGSGVAGWEEGQGYGHVMKRERESEKLSEWPRCPVVFGIYKNLIPKYRYLAFGTFGLL